MTDRTETAAATAKQMSETAASEETSMTEDKTGAADTQTRAADTSPKATKPAPEPAPEDRSRGVDTDALVSEARAQERERVARVRSSPDMRIGREAFLAKLPPDYPSM